MMQCTIKVINISNFNNQYRLMKGSHCLRMLIVATRRARVLASFEYFHNEQYTFKAFVNFSKIVELEEELRVVGNNLKSLEVSEEKVCLQFVIDYTIIKMNIILLRDY